MLRLSTKQLMDKSKCFTFLFWGAITVFSIAIILNFIWPFTSCNSYSYYSCSYWYYNYYYECTSYGTTYCCTSGYSTCGSSYYCYTKPYYAYACPGVIIAAAVLYVLAFFMAIAVFIMFCQLKERARQGVYSDGTDITNPLIYNNQPPMFIPNPQQNNPPVVYSDGYSQGSAYTGPNQPVVVNR